MAESAFNALFMYLLMRWRKIFSFIWPNAHNHTILIITSAYHKKNLECGHYKKRKSENSKFSYSQGHAITITVESVSSSSYVRASGVISKPPVSVSLPSTSPASTPVKLPSPSSSPMAPSLVPVSATPSSTPTYTPSTSPVSTVSPTMEPVSSPIYVPATSPSPAPVSPLLAPVESPLTPAPTVSPQISPSIAPVGSPVESPAQDSYGEGPFPSPSVPEWHRLPPAWDTLHMTVKFSMRLLNSGSPHA